MGTDLSMNPATRWFTKVIAITEIVPGRTGSASSEDQSWVLPLPGGSHAFCTFVQWSLDGK